MLTCGSRLLQGAQKVGVVAQTELAKNVAGLGSGTVTKTQFTQNTSPAMLNVRAARLWHSPSASDEPVLPFFGTREWSRIRNSYSNNRTQRPSRTL